MHTHELPLILFTLLSQMAVGSFVVLGVVQVVARRRHDAATVDRLTTPTLYAIGPVMVAALLVSMVHLGNPLNALNVLNHLGTSWLSREILTGCLFTGLGAAFAICQWRGWLGVGLRQVLAGITALVGLAFLWSTAQVYLIPTVPAWNSWTTPVTFFATSFLLGALAIGTAFLGTQAVRRRRGGDPDPVVAVLIRGTLRGIGVACIVLLGVEAVAVPAWVAQVATDGSTAAAGSMATIASAGGAWLIARLVLGVIGAGVLGLVLYRAAVRGTDRLLVVAASSAFVLVLAAEVLGRVLFFSSYGRLGI